MMGKETVDVFDDRPLTLERLAEKKDRADKLFSGWETKKDETGEPNAAPVVGVPNFDRVAHGT